MSDPLAHQRRLVDLADRMPAVSRTLGLRYVYEGNAG